MARRQRQPHRFRQLNVTFVDGKDETSIYFIMFRQKVETSAWNCWINMYVRGYGVLSQNNFSCHLKNILENPKSLNQNTSVNYVMFGNGTLLDNRKCVTYEERVKLVLPSSNASIEIFN